MLTVVDSSRNKTCECEHPIEDAVCGIYQGGILQATSSEIRDGAEHANGRETGDAWVYGERRGMAIEQKDIPTRTTCVMGDLNGGQHG